MNVEAKSTSFPGETFHLSSGTVEALKWVALVAMVVDHVNAVFYSRDLGTLATATGRLALPLFAVVFGYNLARPRVLGPAVRRIAIAGFVAIPFHAFLFSQVAGWWPLNILLTFACAALAIQLAECGTWEAKAWAALVVVVGGALVEYWWPGVALVVVSYAAARYGCKRYAIGGLAFALAGLCVINGNGWALVSFPVLAAAQWWSPQVPRSGRVFLWFYPAHLAAIALLVVVAQ